MLTDNYLAEAGRTLRYRDLTKEVNRFKAMLSNEVMICSIQTKSEYYEIYLSNTKHVVSMQITQMSNQYQCQYQCHILGITELEQKFYSQRDLRLSPHYQRRTDWIQKIHQATRYMTVVRTYAVPSHNSPWMS
jgi:hypothetical protein